MAGAKTRGSGELESEMLRILRAAARPMGAAELQQSCSGRTPAYTTVLTVLERLREKGEVVRTAESPRRVRFAAARGEVEHATDAMQDALAATFDREAVLLRFAGALDASDAAVLRDALGGR